MCVYFCHLKMSRNKILVLACKVGFRSTVNERNIESFNNDYFELTDNGVNISNIDWFDEENFQNEIDNLIAFSREIKNKIKGVILVYVKGPNDNVETGKYHVSSKEWSYSPCEINISIKQKDKEKPKPLTENEKIALFREYWDAKHAAPKKNEIYKGFRIGSFYTAAMKNEDLITALRDIMQ